MYSVNKLFTKGLAMHTYKSTVGYGSVTILDNTLTVTLYDSMGNDLTVVNAARASINKVIGEVDDRDVELIKYLAKNKRMDTFRHNQFTFLLKGIPESLLRQLFKHQVGCAHTSDEVRIMDMPWSEVSGRYAEINDGFYLPSELREQQSSDRHSVVSGNEQLVSEMHDCMVNSLRTYTRLINAGVCREQARLVLPLSFKSSVFVTMSLEGLVNFIKVRTNFHAQVEMQELAGAMYELAHQRMPISIDELLVYK